MWYRNTTEDGVEFIIVDPKAKTREHAFDHERIANVNFLIRILLMEPSVFHSDHLNYAKKGRVISFDVKDKTYTCNLRNYRCTTKENKKGAAADMSPMASFRRGRTQVLSPNGKLAAFIRDHNLWVRNVGNKKRAAAHL